MKGYVNKRLCSKTLIKKYAVKYAVKSLHNHCF